MYNVHINLEQKFKFKIKKILRHKLKLYTAFGSLIKHNNNIQYWDNTRSLQRNTPLAGNYKYFATVFSSKT